MTDAETKPWDRSKASPGRPTRKCKLGAVANKVLKTGVATDWECSCQLHRGCIMRTERVPDAIYKYRVQHKWKEVVETSDQ
jgi:hypothetical protein